MQIENIKEKGELRYTSWYIGLFQNEDVQRGIEIKDLLLERAAFRTMESMQK